MDEEVRIQLVICDRCRRAWELDDGTVCKGCGKEGLVVTTFPLAVHDAS